MTCVATDCTGLVLELDAFLTFTLVLVKNEYCFLLQTQLNSTE